MAIEIYPNVFEEGDGKRYWCLARAPDGDPCPFTTTKFHMRWNSHLCDWHIDEHQLYSRYRP